jgi:hypothetical protein
VHAARVNTESAREKQRVGESVKEQRCGITQRGRKESASERRVREQRESEGAGECMESCSAGEWRAGEQRQRVRENGESGRTEGVWENRGGGGVVCFGLYFLNYKS